MKKRSVKRSLEKSQKVQEQMRKNGQAKIVHKDTHIYSNWLKLRSRAINNLCSLPGKTYSGQCLKLCEQSRKESKLTVTTMS